MSICFIQPFSFPHKVKSGSGISVHDNLQKSKKNVFIFYNNFIIINLNHYLECTLIYSISCMWKYLCKDTLKVFKNIFQKIKEVKCIKKILFWFFSCCIRGHFKQIPFHLYPSILHTVRMHVIRRNDKTTETGQE